MAARFNRRGSATKEDVMTKDADCLVARVGPIGPGASQRGPLSVRLLWMVLPAVLALGAAPAMAKDGIAECGVDSDRRKAGEGHTQCVDRVMRRQLKGFGGGRACSGRACIVRLRGRSDVEFRGGGYQLEISGDGVVGTASLRSRTGTTVFDFQCASGCRGTYRRGELKGATLERVGGDIILRFPSGQGR